MMRRVAHIALFLMLLLSGIKSAMAQSANMLTIKGDRLVVKVDLQSSKTELDSLFKLAGVTVPDVAKFLKGDHSAFKNDGWAEVGRSGNTIEFDKPLSDLNANPQEHPYNITMHIPSLAGKPGYPGEIKYGVNGFERVTVYNLASGLTRFILPGYNRAKRVFLSGSFNGWSTLKGIMTKTDCGWILDIKLEPGAYEYKYIVDGRWIIDPNNLFHTDDEGGNENSVFFKYNYTFTLPGYTNAHRVMLAGDFNHWEANEIVMGKTATGWKREMYINEGLHHYRFMVDGQWVIDPANPLKEKDGDGNVNSSIRLGQTVNFKLAGYPNAKKVSLTGDFNNWNADALQLKRTGNSWSLPLILPKGTYNYSFIVDGKWISDPENSHQVIENDRTESVIAVKPNHTFKLNGFGNAKKVILAGTFNNWNPTGYTLEHKGDEWTIDLYLKPGKYLYKFIVDGNWMKDPGNKYWEQNGNSVLWVE